MGELDPACEMATWANNVRTTMVVTPIALFLALRFWPTKTDNSKPRGHRLTAVDHLLGLTFVAFFIHNLAVRFLRGVGHWSFQPCHILTALFIIVIYHPDNNPDRFLLYFYSVWMPLLGVLFTDPSWYQWAYEQPAFHIQHVLMVIAPWYYVYTGRFELSKTSRFRNYIYQIGISSLYLTSLVWVSYYFEEDFSSTRCRPSFMAFAHTWWRELQLVMAPALALLLGPVPDFIISWLSPHPHVKHHHGRQVRGKNKNT